MGYHGVVLWMQAVLRDWKLENEDPALLLLKQWPECKKYKENPENLQAWNRRYMYIGYN